MVEKRTYTSQRRDQQAAQTRVDVLAAAVELFAETGWARTTISGVAERAGVSADTVYKAFGSKGNLLRGAIDFALVGDDEAVAVAERPEFARIGTGSTEQRLRAGTEFAATIYERSTGVWQAIVEAAPGEPAIEALRAEIEQRRWSDTRQGLELALGEPLDEVALRAAWVLSGPDSYIKLTTELGLDKPGYVTTVVDSLQRLLSAHALRAE